ncbi:leucine-rich repeat serine/threonine-protein kinase 2-like isoform X2 [Ptychodera flava]|uniref:leucine-rich repeat serine/threonine-protein kinase 2-like isoform X2 n=1 Tax=Ptychodera flava TaxID=63121 RepID=UPI00396A4547
MDDHTNDEDRTLDLLLQLKNDFVPKGLCQATEELISLTMNDDCVRIMEGYYAHRLIVEMMKNLRSHAENQRVGCQALSKMMDKSDKLKSLIVQSQAHRYVMQALDDHMEDASVIAAAMETIAYLASAASHCQYMLEKDIIGSVLGTMRTFQQDSNINVQIQACRALSQLLKNDANRQFEMVCSNDYRVITSAIKRHSYSPQLLEHAFAVLRLLCSTVDGCDVLLHGDIHIAVMDAIKSNPKSSGVNAEGCGLLDALAYNDDSQRLLEVRGCSKLILSALQTHRDNAQLQARAFSVLAKLSNSSFQSRPLFQTGEDDDWLEDIHKAMATHLGDPAVQESCCRALTQLLMYRHSVIERIGEDDDQFGIHVNLLACLMVHSDDCHVYQSACSAVYTITAENGPRLAPRRVKFSKESKMSPTSRGRMPKRICKKIQALLMEKGGYIPVLTGLQRHLALPGAQAIGCKAIRGLTLFSPQYKETLVSCGALSDITAAFSAYPNDVDVATEAIGAIACLADVEIVRHQCIAEAIHESIVDSMEMHVSSEPLQEMALEGLAVLSTTEEVYGLLKETQALYATIKAMQNFGDSPAIQKKGCVLLQVLVDPLQLSESSFCETLAELIITALKNFPMIFGVQAEGCVAMQILSEMSDQMSEMFIKEDGHERLFYILDNHSEKLSLVELACECLYVLSCIKDLKSQMLLTACKEGLLTGVECLLQLGADVNVGEGINTPLCYACKRQDIEMVKLLLRQGVTDMQTALRMSLKQESHCIAGLLLKHMGHDREAGIVSWSGLDLGTLHSEWFYPTLLGRAFSASPSALGSGKDLAQRIRKSEEKRLKRQRTISGSYTIPGKDSPDGKLNIRYPWFSSNPSLNRLGIEYPLPRLTGQVADSTDDESSFSEMEDSYHKVRRLSMRTRHPSLDFSSPKLTEQRKSLDGGIAEVMSLCIEEEDWQKFSKTSANLPVSPYDPRSPLYSSSSSISGLIGSQFSPTPVRGEADGQSTSPCDTPRSSPVLFSQADKLDTTYGRSLSFSQRSATDIEDDPFSSRDSSESSMKGIARQFHLKESPRRSSTVGSMSREFSNISVKHFDLSSNHIGSLELIAQSDRMLLCKFASIEKLELSNNSLKEFPVELAKALPGLQQLHLPMNNFEVFPSHLLTNKHLKSLDLSNNKIKEAGQAPDVTSFSLRELNISHNELATIPGWISECVPGLEILSLSGNKFVSLPDEPLSLRRLKTLNLSHNYLKSVPDAFLSNLVALDTIILSNNQLGTLPEEVASKLSLLTTVKISHNRLAENTREPFFIPKFLLQLPSLRSVDLSNNQLVGIPSPNQWKTQSLREILVSHNNIKKLNISTGIKQWMFLERFTLSHNKLQEVPRELGQLTSLTSLDFSNNKAINTIPDELGKLQKLWELPLDGLKLDLDPVLLRGRTKDIIGFLNEKLKQAVPHYRIKMMLVGFAARGKSTLLRTLQRIRSTPDDNIATVGVKVKEWRIPVKKNNKKVQYCLSTWDFAGQEDFYSTHPIFLSQRSLYLVVYDVSRGPEEVKTLKPWLLTIHARSPQSPVIVVGTHKDKVPRENKEEFIREMREHVSRLCSSPGFPDIKGYIEVCGTHENTSIDALRRLIVDVIDGFKVKGQPIMGQMIPHSYVKLEELICEEARNLQLRSQAPIVIHRKLLKLVKDADLQLDEDELSHAIRFLHECGVVLHYDDPALQLKDLYFVDPEWLCRMMAQIVTVREINPFIDNKGVMKKSDLRVLFNGCDFPAKFIPQYTRLLQKFEIALPKSDDELLIPCKMPTQKPKIQVPIHDQLGILRRQYEMPYIPIGFWSRLISRLKLFSQNMISELSELHCNSHHGDTKCKDQDQAANMIEVHSAPHVDYWKEGIYVCWSEQAFFLAEPLSTNRDTLEIITPCTKFGMRLLGQVVDHVDVLIEEWFPGLCEIDPILGRIPVQRLVPCPLCDGSHEYTLEGLVEQSDSDDVIACPNLKKNIPLYNLAPDVVLGDLEDRFRLMYDQFNFERSPEHLLGDGSYGSVYRATYKNQPVAVKVFSKIGDSHPHWMLRQEVTVLRRLRHLSLVSMIGVGLCPRVLVMELAPLGTLSSIQNRDRPLSRGLQHRIALQVAEGLMFLHQHRIIYRDLKPDNILIFSLSLGVLVNAKISDYGISRFATPIGLTASEGTPGYRAPEVAKGDVFYDEKVDVYSFGILLYEVVTGGRKPFEELSFRNELDDAVMKGRTLPPIAMVASAEWPDVQDLIYHCLEQVPEDRPTSEEVFNRLNSAELLCLKKDYPVFKGVSAESIAIRTYSEHGEEKIELWLGGGDSTTGIISWINLDSKDTASAAQGMILKSEDQNSIESRVTSVLCLGSSFVVVGTESGTIWVCDAWRHTCKHQLSRMPDSILCFQHHKGHLGQELLFVGLANGLVAVFSVSSVKAGPCINEKLLTISEDGDPVRCMTTARGKLWLGCGGQVVSIKLDTLAVMPHPGMEYTAGNGNLITNIAVSKHLWISRRGSPLVELWDINKANRHSVINCETLLRHHDQTTSTAVNTDDYCVKSLSMQSQHAMWIGTSGGHVILVETSTTSNVICVIRRHTGPVKSIAVREVPGSHQASLVVTVGSGFVGRPGSPIEKSDMEYTYALVWDSALSRQVHKLKADYKRREDWQERHEPH